MKTARSRLSPQGQISVPAEVRQLLGLAPGSVLEWELQGQEVHVRRAGRYSSRDIHSAAFGKPRSGKVVSVEEMDDAIACHLEEKHARG